MESALRDKYQISITDCLDLISHSETDSPVNYYEHFIVLRLRMKSIAGFAIYSNVSGKVSPLNDKGALDWSFLVVSSASRVSTICRKL